MKNSNVAEHDIIEVDGKAYEIRGLNTWVSHQEAIGVPFLAGIPQGV